MVAVNLRDLPHLQRALTKLGVRFEKEATRGIRRAARFGATAVVQTSSETDPRPRAFGTYESGWTVTNTRDGAILGNPVRHAPFVEKGRLPGRQPPLKPILAWVIQKRLGGRRGGRRGAKFIARAVARKIGRKGVKGRYVLKRTMPAIIARTNREIRRAVAKMVSSPPR